MMKTFFLFTLTLMIVAKTNAQEKEIMLYSGTIPGAIEDKSYKEETVMDGVLKVSKVSQPSLIPFFPSKPNGTAVIICPGGGYSILAIDHEGYEVAKKFNEIGVTAFVLKYRLPSAQIMKEPAKGPLQDAQQAIYMLRKNALKYKIDQNKIGIMGFSAGGHLAVSASTQFNDVLIDNKENIGLKPDFTMLIYPVISFKQNQHQGSVNNLLGKNPSEKQLNYFSGEENVSANTPPAFLVHASDDEGVPVANSVQYYEAMLAKKRPVEMHLYQAGGHGFGLNNKTTTDAWFERCVNWLKAGKLID